jgi:hypothetical protein
MDPPTVPRRLKVHREEFALDYSDCDPPLRKMVDITRDDVSGVWCDSCKMMVTKLPVMYSFVPQFVRGALSPCCQFLNREQEVNLVSWRVRSAIWCGRDLEICTACSWRKLIA